MLTRLALALVCSAALGLAQSPSLFGSDGQYLGNLNFNKYDPNSVSNPSGPYGSPYSSTSINNPYSKYGSPFSQSSVRNPYAPSSQAPKVIAPDGAYLGDLSANPYSASSISNPYGQYGSRYSPTSIKNPYGAYGSRYSPSSVRNPFSFGSAPQAPARQPLFPTFRTWR